jgi:hypothetical protein
MRDEPLPNEFSAGIYYLIHLATGIGIKVMLQRDWPLSSVDYIYILLFCSSGRS